MSPHDPSVTVAATANVMYLLPDQDARAALAGVLDRRPDLVVLQEWSLKRTALLRETGPVRVEPGLGLRLGRRPRARPHPSADAGDRVGAGDHPAYLWVAPVLGSCPVGLRTDRFELLGARLRLLDRPGRVDPGVGQTLRPAKIATVVSARDLHTGRTVSTVGYHLSAGVQWGGHYRDDRPIWVASHRRQVRSLERVVAGLLARGHVVHAAGDSNLHGLRLPGLTSAWEGRDGHEGTLGRRLVDDVFGPGPAASVELLSNASDHRAVVVTRAEGSR